MHASTSTGFVGEDLAARFLISRGVSIVARNVHAGGGELDLIADHGGRRFAIEVKTATNGDDPMDAVDEDKVSRLWSAAGACGIDRIDVILVTVDAAGVSIRWIPSAV